MKKCNKCGKIKPKSDFHKRATYQHYICKTCESERNKIKTLKKKNREKIVVKEKKCSICKIIKLKSEFNKDIYTKDGLASRCRECNKIYRKNGCNIRESDEWHIENLRKHRESKRRYAAKRRKLGYKMLNEWQEDYDGHHIDKYHIIFMPHHLHKSIQHNVWNGNNMKEINELAFKYL